MKRKTVAIICLWLCLAAMVVFYTDREAGSWTFTGDPLSYVAESPEEAEAAEEAYAAMMRREQAAAAERTARGQWGTEESENNFYDTLPAWNEDGLNLMWGEYEAELLYDAPQEAAVRITGAGRQSFIRGGEAVLPAGEGETAVIPFTLTDSAEHLYVVFPEGEGLRLRMVSVRKVNRLPFSRDLAAYAVLAGIVLTGLLLLSRDTRPGARERRRDALILVCAAAFASMPLLWDGLQDGHDLIFHLNRIEGIASALRCGQFPARIHASTLAGFGYAAPEFYPELFLYFPALLRNLGVSLLDSLRVFEMTINLLAAFSCYACARRLTGSCKAAMGASVLYVLSIYRLVNLYVRATLGESLAMIFFPVLILAMEEVLSGDEKRWPLLTLAMTGIAMSHLLSTLFAALFCLLAALTCVPRLLREPRRIVAILLAAALTALCCAGFFVPMLCYLREDISTSVVLDASQHVLKPGSFFVIFSGNNGTIAPEREDFAYTIGVVPGVALLTGVALLLVRLYMQGRRKEKTPQEAHESGLYNRLLALGILALACSTEFMPWARLVDLPHPFSTLFRQMQFPWRLVSIAVPMLVIVSVHGYLFDRKRENAGLALMLVLAVTTAGYTMQCFVQDPVVLERDSFVDTRIGQFEYTYVGTEKEALSPGEITAQGEHGLEPAVVSAYEKQGTDLSFELLLPNGGKYVELPLLYYPGYHAAVEGKGEIRVLRGTNNRIRLLDVTGGETMRIRIWFAEPVMWRAAEAAGALAFLALILLLARMRRRSVRL
ncbi:MAG: hypothetical protein IJ573_01425 [Clostridia bacterium]|nr:hypothetical protein [Clostridia bacterium]